MSSGPPDKYSSSGQLILAREQVVLAVMGSPFTRRSQDKYSGITVSLAIFIAKIAHSFSWRH